MLGKVNCLVGVIWGVEFGLGGKEDIIGDAAWAGGYLLKGNSSLGDLHVVGSTFCIVSC